jgi:peptidoglycan/xylan/chitin deacetylase (PgdA/CDA1 family)
MSPTLFTLAALAVLGGGYAAVPRLVLQAQRRHLGALCRRRRVVALTFDDGPGSVLTPQVLDRLAAVGVPATFFVLGQNLRGNEALVAQMVQRGHEVGSHGDLHPHHIWSLPWVGLCDTQAGYRRLAQLLPTTAASAPFRPPFGRLNLLSLAWLWWRRRRLAMWTHDGHDTRLGARIAPAAFADAVRAHGGGVVLLHDFDRGTPDGLTDVLARLDAVLRLRDEGYEFVRMSELLAAPAAVPTRG